MIDTLGSASHPRFLGARRTFTARRWGPIGCRFVNKGVVHRSLTRQPEEWASWWWSSSPRLQWRKRIVNKSRYCSWHARWRHEHFIRQSLRKRFELRAHWYGCGFFFASSKEKKNKLSLIIYDLTKTKKRHVRLLLLRFQILFVKI